MAPGVSSAVGMRVAGMGRAVKPVIRFAGESPLVDGLAGATFAYTPAPVWMEKDADLPAPQTITPAFHVVDRAAEPLAYWAGTNRVAVAVKREPWGTSIFCALPLVPRRFLRNLLAAAGGHIYCPSDDVWLANRSLLAVHTRQGGRREVRLPQPARVTDAMTGRAIAKRTAVFSVQLPRRSTSMWLLEA